MPSETPSPVAPLVAATSASSAEYNQARRLQSRCRRGGRWRPLSGMARAKVVATLIEQAHHLEAALKCGQALRCLRSASALQPRCRRSTRPKRCFLRKRRRTREESCRGGPCTSSTPPPAPAEARPSRRSECGLGDGAGGCESRGLWLSPDELLSLMFRAGLQGDDPVWMSAFTTLCDEQGCDATIGVSGATFVRLVMDDLVRRCRSTSLGLQEMLRLPCGPCRTEEVLHRAPSSRLAPSALLSDGSQHVSSVSAARARPEESGNAETGVAPARRKVIVLPPKDETESAPSPDAPSAAAATASSSSSVNEASSDKFSQFRCQIRDVNASAGVDVNCSGESHGRTIAPTASCSSYCGVDVELEETDLQGIACISAGVGLCGSAPPEHIEDTTVARQRAARELLELERLAEKPACNFSAKGGTNANRVPDVKSFSTSSGKGGMAQDIVKHGGTLAELLGAGDWHSKARGSRGALTPFPLPQRRMVRLLGETSCPTCSLLEGEHMNLAVV
eukprot:TRINITY_DN4760_c0_g1_i4.p1 TRINITY_DN4760_c0_g1~~TRINITY_DN4760_c0_g1_i4.p1  ORF type:complete len:507 (+),score=84.59 TRINITY_DN4760_c0_g1_i4:78-1598(+)